VNPFKTFFQEWKKQDAKERTFMVLGGVFLVSAVVGIFLPVVPQIPFAIISAYFFF